MDELKNIYVDATQWQNKTFPEATPLSCVNHLQEEVEELKESIELDSFDKKEIADCFFMLFGICNTANISYDEILGAIKEKLEINKTRKWGAKNENGYWKHEQ